MIMCLNPIVKIPLEELKKIQIHSKNLKTFNNFNHLSDNDKNILVKYNVLNKCQFFNCKKCNLCLKYKRFDWVKRAVNEWPNWKNHYFITLTFDDKNYKNFWFEPRFLSKWIKEILRKKIGECTYLGSQEFGEKTWRKHYHLILFTNFDFDDLEYLKKTKKNNKIYTSKFLNQMWKFGSCNQINPISSIAEINYVCSYSVKKLKNGKSNPLIPKNYQGEKLIIARGFGDKLNLESNKEILPYTLFKNSDQRLYIAKRKLKRKEITPLEYEKIFKKEEPYQKLKTQIKKDNWSIEVYNQLLTDQLTKSLDFFKHKTEV